MGKGLLYDPNTLSAESWQDAQKLPGVSEEREMFLYVAVQEVRRSFGLKGKLVSHPTLHSWKKTKKTNQVTLLSGLVTGLHRRMVCIFFQQLSLFKPPPLHCWWSYKPLNRNKTRSGVKHCQIRVSFIVSQRVLLPEEACNTDWIYFIFKFWKLHVI